MKPKEIIMKGIRTKLKKQKLGMKLKGKSIRKRMKSKININ